MKTSKLSVVVKGSIIAFGLCGLVMCLLWYPFSISLSTMGVVAATPTLEQNVQMWTQLLFYWGVSIPCFIVLAIAWRISTAIKKDEVFSSKVAKQIKKCTIILLVDVIIFFIGNIVFMLLGWNDFAFIYFIIAVIGIVVVSVLSVVSHYVTKAAILQEETEGTI